MECSFKKVDLGVLGQLLSVLKQGHIHVEPSIQLSSLSELHATFHMRKPLTGEFRRVN